MTIAACYLSPEGVIIGADSAATFGPDNHFFHEQKIFEIGEPGKSRLAMTFWGLGSLMQLSFRTLLARFSDEIIANPGRKVKESAEFWRNMFWNEYVTAYAENLERLRVLRTSSSLTTDEGEELKLSALRGFGWLLYWGMFSP